jgi:hypothetical protein
MDPDVMRFRREIDTAHEEVARLQKEMTRLGKTLDPGRPFVSPEELRLMTECSEWVDRLYDAEHAHFRAEHGTPGIIGSNGAFQWLTSVDHDLADLLCLCPAVVLNKRLAVTSIDGGALRLSEAEKNAGWSTSEEGRIYRSGFPTGTREYRDDWMIAYSPLVESIHGLPNETRLECCGLHEWFVFEQEIPVGEIESFVNWMGVRMYDPASKFLSDRFWDQIPRLAPESYIAEGSVLTFVTRNAPLFSTVLAAFSEPPS